MGDAADDAFDAALKRQAILETMHDAGCRRCAACPPNGDECPICHDLGWIDKNGDPCEP